MKRFRAKRLSALLLSLLIVLPILFLFSCSDQGKGDKGDPGEQGVSIVKTELIDGELIVTYSDGRKENLGQIPGESDPNVSALDFYPLPDDTYGVKAGNADYLNELVIPSTYKGRAVTQILGSGFKNLTNLTNITLPEGLKNIGASAFDGCSSLESITVPGSVTEIGEGAFFNCSGLKFAVLSEGVTTIGNYAFQRCYGLTSVTVPSTLTEIGQTAFRDCYRLVEVICHSQTLELEKGSADNGYLAQYALEIHNDSHTRLVKHGDFMFYTAEQAHHLVEYIGQDTQVTLPAYYNKTPYEIHDYAFYGCATLTGITLPDTLTGIGDHAFSGCSELTAIHVPDSVQRIGATAFAGCEKLTELTIPALPLEIGINAFGETGYALDESNWESGVLYLNNHLIGVKNTLEKVTVKENTLTIGDSVFSSCIGLTEITVPVSVTVIGESAFAHCSRLSKIHYDGTLDDWKKIQKGADWDAEVAYYTVKASDGNQSSDIIK